MPALNNSPTGNQAFNFPAVLRGTVVALVVSILGAALLGILFYFFNFSEKFLSPVSGVVLFLSVFSGGLLAAHRAGNRGIYHGLAVGIVFFAVSWLLVTLFFPGNTVFLNVLQKLAVIIMAGGMGGVLGVGLSS